MDAGKGTTAADSMKILLAGGAGQVGWELRRTLAPIADVLAPGRSELDVADPDAVADDVELADPDLVVNAAAMNDVDGAEEEPGRAEAVNARGPRLLAEGAARSGAALVHYSTDYVFGGGADRPYTEEDEPAPVNTYGETKLAGERAVLSAEATALVLRTSWVYSLRRDNFLRTMLAQFGSREEVRVVEDQVSVPTWARTVAEATAQLVGRALSRGSGGRERFGEAWDGGGLYHLVPAGRASRWAFARAILEGVRRRLPPERVATERVKPVGSEEWPSAARRPGFSALDPSRLARRFGLRLPDWREELGRCLDGLSTCRDLRDAVAGGKG